MKLSFCDRCDGSIPEELLPECRTASGKLVCSACQHQAMLGGEDPGRTRGARSLQPWLGIFFGALLVASGLLVWLFVLAPRFEQRAAPPQPELQRDLAQQEVGSEWTTPAPETGSPQGGATTSGAPPGVHREARLRPDDGVREATPDRTPERTKAFFQNLSDLLVRARYEANLYLFWGGQQPGAIDREGSKEPQFPLDRYRAMDKAGADSDVLAYYEVEIYLGQQGKAHGAKLREDALRLVWRVVQEDLGLKEEDELDPPVAQEALLLEVERRVRELGAIETIRLARADLRAHMESKYGEAFSNECFEIAAQPWDEDLVQTRSREFFDAEFVQQLPPESVPNGGGPPIGEAENIDRMLQAIRSGCELESEGARRLLVVECNAGRAFSVELLLRAGVPASWPDGTYGPIHEVAQWSGPINERILTLLIERAARADARDHNGRTALDHALEEHYPSAAMIDGLVATLDSKALEDVLVERLPWPPSG